MDPESPQRRSVVVRAEEAPRTTVAYGIGYAEHDLPARQRRGDAPQPLRHGPQPLRLRAGQLPRQPAARRPTASRTCSGRKQELFVTAFREEEDREAFDFVRTGVPLQTARALSPSWSLILRYTYQETRTFNITEDCLTRSTASSARARSPGPSASVVHDTRDDPLDPRRGHFLRADAQVSLRVLGGDTFVKGFVQGATYRLAHRGHARGPLRAPGPGAHVRRGAAPRCRCPTASSPAATIRLRGFGAGRGAPGRRQRAACSAASSCARTCWRASGAPAFAEAGNVYPLVSDLTLGDLRYTAGLGPALQERPRSLCVSTGATSSTAGRARSPTTSTSRSAMRSEPARPCSSCSPPPGGRGWWSGSWPWWTAAPCCSPRCALLERCAGDTERQPWTALIDEQLMFRRRRACPRPR